MTQSVQAETTTAAAATSRSASPGEPDVRLFRHSKCNRWGVAALLWERDGKRGYQFSDGKLRVFKQGFYHLFEPTAPPGDGSAKAVRRLARLARADDLTAATRLPTLRDQITLFRRSYPEGFVGAAWAGKHRGVGARKRLARHRDPAISEAHQLSVEQLAPVIERRDWPTVFERLEALATSTNLVPAAHVKHLRALRPTRELAVALFEWIEAATGEAEAAPAAGDAGDDDKEAGGLDRAELDRRFNYLARLLGPAGTWPVMTAIAGLLDPENHTCVRPSAYAVQAKMLLPAFSVDKRPRYISYTRYLHVAQTVFDELEAAGLAPRDLLDVHDFIWETLRPAAREALTHQHELPPLAAEPAAEQQVA